MNYYGSNKSKTSEIIDVDSPGIYITLPLLLLLATAPKNPL